MTPANKLFVETTGEGPSIVMLHGGASSHRYWYPLSKFLPRHRIILPDLLGLGDSPKPNNLGYTTTEHVQALHEAFADVPKPFTLVGHSIGAILAVAYAKQYPTEVARLILSSPIFYIDASEAKRFVVKAVDVPDMIIWGPFAALICNTLCRVKPAYLWLARLITPKRIPDWMIEDSAKHTWPSYSRTMKNVVFKQTTLTDLENMTAPTTIIWGEDDASIVEANLRKVDQNENVMLVEFNHGHNIPVFQAEKLAEIINAN